MAKNTGKPSEETFDKFWAKLGKKAFVFKFTDASEARGMNKRTVNIKAQPSDRLITFQGVTWYAEVKSTIDEKRFNFSLLRTTQGSYAAQVEAAGGMYLVYIHSIATDIWYCVPYSTIRWAKENNKSSFTWQELSTYLWEAPSL